MRATVTKSVLLVVVLGAVMGVVIVFRGEDEGGEMEVVREATDAGDAASVARLAGSAPPEDDASIEELLGQLKYFSGNDEEARSKIAARASTDPDLVARLIAMLDWSEAKLGASKLRRYQVLQALVAIGRPAALPLARYAVASKRDDFDDVYGALGQMGPAAASAVPALVEAWPELGRAQVIVLRVFQAVGPDAASALPLLLELVRPPVVDDLSPHSGRALLTVSGGSPEAVQALRDALVDEETLARPWLLRAIGDLPAGTESLVPLLVDLLRDPERPTQEGAAYALGGIGATSREVLLGLVRLLDEGTAEGQRQAALALAKLGEPGAKILIEVAYGAEDVDDRLAAFGAMMVVEVDATAHVQILLDILEEDVERGWKQRALAYLRRLEPQPDVALVLPYLERALADERLSQGALNALAQLPGEEVRTLIRKQVEAADDVDAVVGMARTLRRFRIEEPAATARLLEHLEAATEPKDLKRLLDGLNGLRPPPAAAEALPLIEPHLAHQDWPLRHAAYGALSIVEGEPSRVVDLLLAGLAGTDYGVASYVGRGLQRFPDQAPRTLPVVIEALARQASTNGWVNVALFLALVELAPHWSGTKKALDEAEAAANERGKRVLGDLRKRHNL